MKQYNPGEIVLLSFPFSDARTEKRRPALIMLDTGDDDIIVARITSQPPRNSFDLELIDWEKAGLLIPSTVCISKIATLEKNIVERKLGKLTPDDWIKVVKCIKSLCTLIIDTKI